MKIIVNPAYEHLRKFVESIPDIFESEGRVIYSGRNLIKVMTVDDGFQSRSPSPHFQRYQECFLQISANARMQDLLLFSYFTLPSPF